MGCACASYDDAHVRNVKSKRVQCDEIWAFVYGKAKNITQEQWANGAGDVWTWTAIDADTKLIVTYVLGERDANTALTFMEDLVVVQFEFPQFRPTLAGTPGPSSPSLRRIHEGTPRCRKLIGILGFPVTIGTCVGGRWSWSSGDWLPQPSVARTRRICRSCLVLRIPPEPRRVIRLKES